ncbi:hypothetical protein MF406_17005 [Georgenia sp. TF02-10]|uniref:hypothetical protein n=1 Tax=Georgenia sp. TF02-10 TaxID=2917725 RepID=UPI001FA6C6C7|nr:hypothetical protein [Georgenia sp. TF02-10]UNX54557.1 hypothetical protein MF406_17005 [Georgenia sp. TF02-10]
MRHAPRLGRFIFTGVVLGAVVSLTLVLLTPPAAVGRSALFWLVFLSLGAVGGLAGAAVGVAADRRSWRRVRRPARTVPDETPGDERTAREVAVDDGPAAEHAVDEGAVDSPARAGTVDDGPAGAGAVDERSRDEVPATEDPASRGTSQGAAAPRAPGADPAGPGTGSHPAT